MKRTAIFNGQFRPSKLRKGLGGRAELAKEGGEGLRIGERIGATAEKKVGRQEEQSEQDERIEREKNYSTNNLKEDRNNYPALDTKKKEDYSIKIEKNKENEGYSSKRLEEKENNYQIEEEESIKEESSKLNENYKGNKKKRKDINDDSKSKESIDNFIEKEKKEIEEVAPDSECL